MRIKEYRAQFIQELSSIHGADEAESFFYLILEDQKQLKRIDLALQPDLVFSDADLDYWNAILFGIYKSNIPQVLF